MHCLYTLYYKERWWVSWNSSSSCGGNAEAQTESICGS